jgi:tetratricopeptide (TPR) repeat protein
VGSILALFASMLFVNPGFTIGLLSAHQHPLLRALLSSDLFLLLAYLVGACAFLCPLVRDVHAVVPPRSALGALLLVALPLVAVPLGFLLPPLALPLLLLPTLLDALHTSNTGGSPARGDPGSRPDGFGHSLPIAFSGALGSFVAAFAVGATWSSLRALLDPTPWTLICSCVLLLLLAVAPSTSAQRLMGPGALRWAGLPAALLTAALLPTGVASLSAEVLPSRAGLPSTRLLLSLMLAIGVLAPALPTLPFLRAFRPPKRAPMLLGAAMGLPLSVLPGASSFFFLTTFAGLLGLGALLLTRGMPSRVPGALALLAAIGVGVGLHGAEERLLAVGWFTRLGDKASCHRSEALLARSEWKNLHRGAHGTMALRAIGRGLVIDADGVPLERVGRNADAVRFAAHLALLLSEGPRSALVLGDDAALAAPELAEWKLERLEAGVSIPRILEALSEEDPSFSRPLLHPSVRLHASPAGLLLARAEPVGAIVHIWRQGWTDATGQPPDRRFFGTVRSHLATGGAYVGVVKAGGMDDALLARVLRAFLEIFPEGQGWMPLSGADSLLIVGRAAEGPPSLLRLKYRFDEAPRGLRALGAATFLDVADRAALDASGLRGLGVPNAFLGPWLPPSVTRPFRPGLPGATGGLADPEAMLDLVGVEDTLEALRARRKSLGHVLELLDRSAAGDLGALLDEAGALRRLEAGPRALEALVAPQLARARDALLRARGEGILSPAWGEAENALNVALLVHPENLDAVLLLATLYENRGDAAAAESGYTKVLERRPDALDALFGLARIRERRGRLPEAEEALREATRVHPRRWESWQNLGVLLLHLNRLDDAEAALRRAAGLADASVAAPNAGLAEVFLAQGRVSAAMVEAERAVRLAPTAYHLFLRGRCYYELGQLDRAEQDFQRAVLVDPDFYLARGALGLIFAQRGDHPQAAEAFRAVLAADPGNVPARVNLKALEDLLTDRSGGRAPPPSSPPGG